MPSYTIGLIGCGLMGHGIAGNLLKHGHQVTILDHPGNQPVDDLLQQGAQLADSLAQTAANQQFVILCVPGSEQLQQLVLGADGLLPHLSKGCDVIDATTAEPEIMLTVSEAIEKVGAHYADASMTRTPKEAELGRLNVLVGGSNDQVDRIRPVIECYAENIFHGGPVGSGIRMKLLHNFISLGSSVLLAEAYSCAAKAKVDKAVFTQVLATGGGNSVVLDRLMPYIENQDPGGFRFSLANAKKDLGYYRHMATELQATTQSAEALHATLEQAILASDEQRMMPELIDILFSLK